jgi:hypothetical protein
VFAFLVVMVCIALHQAIVVQLFHSAPLLMELLQIPIVVTVARINAHLPMVYFARRQPIVAVTHHVPSKMVLLLIPIVVNAEPTHVQHLLHQEFTRNVQMVNVQKMVP